MKTCLTFAAGLVLLLAVACGDTNADSFIAPEDLTSAQLALMVLPQEAFGEGYAKLRLDGDSGPQDAEALADDTLDPNDTDEDVVDSGWQRGHVLEFNNPKLFETNEPGVYAVSSSVVLFDDSKSAADFVELEIRNGDQLAGRDLDGITLVNFLEYGVPDYADESWGYTVALQIGDKLVYGTVTIFRKGPLLATTGISTTGSGDLRTLVEMWAEALEARVDGVLDGTITVE